MWWGERPRYCLQIGSDALVWAQARRRWMGKRYDHCVVRPLDRGLIRLSPIEPNVVEVGTLQEHIRLVSDSAKRKRFGRGRTASWLPIPIVLLLPDVCVCTAVFELERVPRRREERDALVRWRFGQDHLFPLADSSVVYQIIPGGQSPSSDARPRVLAAAVRRTVLEQYERLCVSAQLLPVEVTTPSLRLCNLWLSRRSSSSRSDFACNVLWVSVQDHSFSVLGVCEGRPLFTRAKLMSDLAPSSAGSGSGPGDRRDLVIREVGVSMQLWQEAAGAVPVERVVLAIDQADEGLLSALREAVRMPVESLDWSWFRQRGWGRRVQQLPLRAMPAVAGLC